MKKLLLILLVYSFPLLLSALTGCDDCNPDPIRFGIARYDVYLGNAESEDQYVYPPDTIAANDTVDFKKLSIVIAGKLRSVASYNETTCGTEAWACDPAIIPVDRIQSITVSSSASYNATLPAGANLSPVLSIARPGLTQQAFSVFDNAPEIEAQDSYSIRLAQAPESNGTHKFTVKIELTNGQSFSATTPPVYIENR